MRLLLLLALAAMMAGAKSPGLRQGVSGADAGSEGPVPPVAGQSEELRSIGALAPHIASAFEEITECHAARDGSYIVFDRRAHAVYSVPPGAEAPVKLLQVGAESGRILQPIAFDSSPDGVFVVADAPEGVQRIQFFSPTGTAMGGFSLGRSGTPQIRLGDLVVSGIASVEFTGQTILLSQPETGALVTEYTIMGSVLRTFGELRATGQENDPQVHRALNAGLPLLIPKGGYYFVFVSGVPMFRKYAADGELLFERHIEGPELDDYLKTLPTTWPRRASRQGEFPIVPSTIRTAAVDRDGHLWISLAVPSTYVYDAGGDKRRTLEFRGAGSINPTSFHFTRDGRVLVTPGCYAFSAHRTGSR